MRARDGLDHVQISSWTHTQRALARCKRLARRERNKDGPVTWSELQEAEAVMIRHMQMTALRRSREAVIQGKPLPTDSPIKKLTPFIDQDGVMRVGGRLGMATSLSFEEKHQRIVPAGHPWTAALIRQAHVDSHHQGPAHVLNQIRRKFWIPTGLRRTKTVVANCVECKRRGAKPQPQQMAPIIEDRFPESRCKPFTYTALDAAGPYFVKDKGDATARKAYFTIFTCCTIRAIHLEPIYDMSANSFLLALDRFTARRGKPKRVRSDNGTNFVAGVNELRKIWKESVWEEIMERRGDIEWIFNPPKAPYFGGLYERMVAAVKRAIYHAARANWTMKTEVFHTTLTVVEGIINSRPLTYLSDKAEDPTPITPAHFLGTSPYRSLAEAPGEAWDRRTLWRATQQVLDNTWKRFCTEMKGSLQPTHKWTRERSKLGVGDVVVVLEAKERGRWPLGRIVRTEESRDGLVRKVHVQFKGHTVRRPVNTLIPLVQEPAVAGTNVEAGDEDGAEEHLEEAL